MLILKFKDKVIKAFSNILKNYKIKFKNEKYKNYIKTYYYFIFFL